MNLPVTSRPLEPALFARAADLERHRVAPGGLTVFALEAGDRLEVIDLEGDQPAELLAFAEDGREALAALGLQASAGADAIARLLHDGSRESIHVTNGLTRRGVDCRRLPAAARLWPAATPAGFSRQLLANAALCVIVAALVGVAEWTASSAPVNCVCCCTAPIRAGFGCRHFPRRWAK